MKTTLSCVALALSLSACAPAPLPAGTDFYCTVQGVESFLVEDVTQVTYSGAANQWRVITSGVTYYYSGQYGEACTVTQ